MARWTALIVLVTAAACGSDEGTTDAGADTRADTTVAPDTVAPDTTPDGTRCCPLGNCPIGDSCIDGACLPATGAGECYGDSVCLPGQSCVGAAKCGCGDVDCEPAPGACRYPEGCCQGDGDCAGSELCVQGTCQSPTTLGRCWRDGQCKPGEACEGLSSCPCGDTSCEAEAGYCGVAGVCCLTDLECGGGLCRGGGCVPAATDDACYGDDDCDGAEVCHGASLCPCGGVSACDVPTTGGRCAASDAACCTTADDCDAGELCVEGQGCRAVPAADGCWVDGHCGVGRRCQGATVCDCGDDACTPVIGECVTETASCASDGDCGVGMRCSVADRLHCPGEDAPTAGVCVERVDEGCWASSDCPPSLRCAGETVCIDPAGCDAKNVPGHCRDRVTLRNCCDSHLECQPGLQCRNQNTSGTCPPDGSAVCVSTPFYGEGCWNYHDCPDGFVCNRAIISGCGSKLRWYNEGVCEKPQFCQSDVDCGTDEICARDPECILSPCTTQSTCNPGGQCQPRVEGFCWTHAECGAGNYCEGLFICQAGSECLAPDRPGSCGPRAELGECCTSYRGCESGLRCVSVAAATGCSLDFTSVCVPAITVGTDCFADDDCGADQRCAGPIICPCGTEDCEGPPQPGSCVSDL